MQSIKLDEIYFDCIPTDFICYPTKLLQTRTTNSKNLNQGDIKISDKNVLIRISLFILEIHYQNDT